MPRLMLRRALCAAAAVGTLLLLSSGCEQKADKSGVAVAPDKMDTSKQQQYKDFMSKKGAGGPGKGMPSGPPPGAPGGPPAKGPGGAPGG